MSIFGEQPPLSMPDFNAGHEPSRRADTPELAATDVLAEMTDFLTSLYANEQQPDYQPPAVVDGEKPLTFMEAAIELRRLYGQIGRQAAMGAVRNYESSMKAAAEAVTDPER